MKHRKNTFCILLIAAMLFLSACGDYVPSVEQSKNSDQIGYSFMLVEYWDFETCIGRAANIVQAKYVGASPHGNYLYLEFEPVNQIKGQIDTETFVVSCVPNQQYRVANASYWYSENPERYEVGKEYILVLEKRMSVYYDQDRYLLMGDIFLPVDELSASTMYGTGKLTEISDRAEQFDSDYEQMTSYITKVAQTSVLKPITVGTDYIRSNDLREITEATECIFRIKVTDYLRSVANNNTERFMCKVVESLKGEPIGEEIEVIFSAGTVKAGKEYIVLLVQREGSTYYILSSKNSVHPASDKKSLATIKEAIAGE